MENVKNTKAGNAISKLLGTIAIGGTIAANLMACSPQAAISNSSFASQGQNDVQVIDFDAATSDRKVKAEQMALVAESLVRDNTMHQAWQLAFRALEQDQFNKRAQFVLKTTAPLMEFKGIYKRILPVVSVQPINYKKYTKYLSDLQKANYQPDMTRFFMNGEPDLHSERQVQDVLEKVVERMDELRDWLKENRKTDFAITTYEVTGDATCSAQELRSNVWKLTNCRTGVVKRKAKMNIADFEAARLAVAGVQTYLAITTAYSFDGAMKNLRLLPKKENTTQEKFENLSKIKGLGELRNTKFQVLLPKVMTDFAVGLKIAKKMHKTLCPKGEVADNSRNGMLFHAGLCAENAGYTDTVIATIEAMGRGQLVKLAMATNEEAVDATFNAKAFFQNPPRDLLSLAPKFDGCGEVESLGDGTVNGVFVNGELNTILRSASRENCR